MHDSTNNNHGKRQGKNQTELLPQPKLHYLKLGKSINQVAKSRPELMNKIKMAIFVFAAI